jgi:hypothetical protein
MNGDGDYGFDFTSYNQPLDYSDYSNYVPSFGGDVPSMQVPDLGGGGGSANPFGNMSWGQMIGGGLGAGAGALGIAGVLQQMLGGGQQQPLNTQQRASLNQGLQSLGNAQGAGSSLLAAMQQLQPLQMQAATQGLQGQMGLLNQFQPWMTSLAQGNLPLSPQISALIDQAYAPSFGSAFQQATDAGRARGFFDNPATGPVGGNVLGQMMPQLAGQEAQAKLNFATQAPSLVGQAVNNYSPLTQAFNQGSQQQSNIMGALTGASDVGSLARIATKPQQPTLLQSAGQFGDVLAGLGGLATGLASLSGTQQPQNGYRY